MEAAPKQRVPQAAPWVLWWVLPLEPPLAWRDRLGGPCAGVRGRRNGVGQEGRLGHTPLLLTAQGLALTHVREQNLKPGAGPRPEAAKVVVLVTDGKSQDDAHAAGRVLKDLGVAVFAVGEQPPSSAGFLMAGRAASIPTPPPWAGGDRWVTQARDPWSC